MDLDKALEALNSERRRDWTAGKVELPNGTILSDVQIDDDEDSQLFHKTIEQVGRLSPIAPTTKVERAAETSHGLLLSTAITTHLKDLERRRLDNKTQTESRHTLRIFLGLTGDIPVTEIKPDHCRVFMDEVVHFPRNATKRREYKDLSIQQAITRAKRVGEPKIARYTLEKHFSRLRVFFQSLIEPEHIIPFNPLSTTFKPDSQEAGELGTGRAFTQDELNLIFGDAFLSWAKKYPHRFWGVIIGLYSGARVNEVAQLYKDDFEKVGDRWGFHINKDHTGQRVKNKVSHRFLPLASPILEIGLTDWLSHVKTTRIFPHLPGDEKHSYGRQLSRQFSSYIKGLGIDEPHLGFHAFRHTISSRLYDDGVSVEDIGLVTGHKTDSKARTILEAHYIEATKRHSEVVNRPAFKVACHTIDRFDPQVNLPAYQDWERLHRDLRHKS